MKTGIELIKEERDRQISKEGFTLKHDAQHTDGELANAACVYAMTDEMIEFLDQNWGDDNYLHFWPFGLEWLKKDRSDNLQKRIKDLTKAGAMIAAEIDRLQLLE